MNNFSVRPFNQIHNHHFTSRPIYWSVLDHETGRYHAFDYKSDALIHQKTLRHATLYFSWYEDAFSKLKIDECPEQSYQTLCGLRARELRETYSYLRLWYSGGCDSHSALMSFVDNDIHLDEIIVLVYPDAGKLDPHDTTADEVLLAAFPQLDKIKNRLSKTKINIIRATEKHAAEWFLDYSHAIPLYDSLDGEGFHLDTNWGLCHVLRTDDKKDWCDIHGGTKARLWKNKNNWYFYFVDSALSTFYISDRSEDFFISRNLPLLFLKTVYNLKTYHENLQNTDKRINRFGHDLVDHPDYNFALGRSMTALISQYKTYHTTHDPMQFSQTLISGKKSNQFYRNVINSVEGTLWFNRYQQSQRDLISCFPDFWNRDSTGQIAPYLGYRGHVSKFYCLNDGLAYDSTEVGFVWVDQ